MTKRIHHNFLLALTASAFDPGTAGWKKDADGKLEIDASGNPIYVDASGREMTVESNTISRLNGESKMHREAKEKAEQKLEAFKDIDPAQARQALETVSKLDQKQLIDAGKVDEVRQQITQQFTTQLTEAQKATQELQQRFDSERINNLFSSSEFVRERVAVPADMFQATFERNFKMEDGKPVAYGRDGNRLMSEKRIGEFADPAEAFELLVNQHPQKDVILKAADANGMGGNGGGNRGGGRTMTRASFEGLNPIQRADAAARMGKGELQITD